MMRSLLIAVCLHLCFALAATAQGAAGSPGEPALRPGDQVRVTVWGMPEMSGDFDVSPDGTLAHPLYREVVVAGVPVAVAEERVGTFLRQRDAVTRFVMQPLVRVSVAGEVSRPSLYHHPVNVTIPNAITMAGGPTGEGNLERVRLIRDGQVSVLDLTDPQGAAVSMPVRSGDQIVVTRSRSFFGQYITPVTSVISAASGVLLLLLRAEVI